MPIDRKEPLSSDDATITCQCAVSYRINARGVAAWEQEPLDVMTMCLGRCDRCGLPYQNDFPVED